MGKYHKNKRGYNSSILKDEDGLSDNVLEFVIKVKSKSFDNVVSGYSSLSLGTMETLIRELTNHGNFPDIISIGKFSVKLIKHHKRLAIQKLEEEIEANQRKIDRIKNELK